MKTIFMGTPDFAATALKALIESENEVGYVVTQPDKARDRGKKVRFSPVKELALKHNIQVLQPEKVKGNDDFIAQLRAYNPDIIIVAAYGKILPKEILEMPHFGCINIHASLLPKLRGASPIQHAIITGEKETGVTIMEMAEGLDTGDMLAKASVEIGNMNFSMLHDALAEIGAKLLIDTLPLIEQRKTKPEVQDDSLATYAGLIAKQDGAIDFSKEPEVIERLIRGFDPWPGAYATYGDNVVKFWSAKALDEKSDLAFGTVASVTKDSIIISCGGKKLAVTEIQMPGKKRVKVSDYLRGNSVEEGTRFK